MKKTIIKIGEQYYMTYNINDKPIFTDLKEKAFVFKTKHNAIYYYQNILKYYGYKHAEFIEVK